MYVVSLLLHTNQSKDLSPVAFIVLAQYVRNQSYDINIETDHKNRNFRQEVATASEEVSHIFFTDIFV